MSFISKKLVKAIKIFIVVIILIGITLAILGHESEFIVIVSNNTNNYSPSPYIIKPIKRVVTPEENLTLKAAKGIAEELLEKNSEGPIEEGEDLNLILNPKEAFQKMISQINFQDAKPFEGIRIEELKLDVNDTAHTRRKYFENLQNIISSAFSGVNEKENAIIDAIYETLQDKHEKLDLLISAHERAIESLKDIPVPTSLAILHKKEIDLLTKTKIMLDGISLISTDPIRAYLALQIYPKLAEEAQALQQEFSAAIENELSQNFFEKTFAAPALAAVPTIETHPLLLAIYPRDLAEWIQRLITEVVKNILVDYLEKLVLDYIKQGGATQQCYYENYFAPGGDTLCPKFVLNWEKALLRAKTTADSRLKEEIKASKIPEENKKALLELLKQRSAGGYGNTFDSLTADVEDCSKIQDPVGYLSCTTDPKNTIEGQTLVYLERKEELQKAYEEGRRSELIANRNFESTKKCKKYGEKNEATGQPECIEWVTTEPGSVTHEMAAEISKVDWDRIVNAYDLKALLAILFTMFINELKAAGLEGILGIIVRGGGPPSPTIYPSPWPSESPTLTPSPTPTPTPTYEPGPGV